LVENLQQHDQSIKDALVNKNAKTVTVLSSLLAVQDSLGYISSRAIGQIASYTKSTINDVWGVASFYTNFRFSRPGENFLEVCWGPTCHLLGAQGVLDCVLQELGLEEEGDTIDAKVSLKFNTCLGACSQGPLISVNHKIIGPRLTGDTNHKDFQRSVVQIVSDLKNGNSVKYG
jgi:NADH:ubiquinone oxidoreductase subunit E